MPYHIKPLPLLSDNDYPIIDIADLLEIGAKADGWKYKRQFAKSREMEGQFDLRESEGIYHSHFEAKKSDLGPENAYVWQDYPRILK